MLDLALSVLCSSLIFVIFKLFDVYNVQTLYAIIVNYLVAFITGTLLYEGSLNLSEVFAQSWFLGTLALGVLFIVIFNLMAKTSQVAGVSVASVATKMSLAIPVVFGMVLYKEQLSVLQILGIVLALAAVYFASIKGNARAVPKKALLLPFLVFLGSGIIDTSMKYFEERHLSNEEVAIFSAMIFGAAAFTGLLFILVNLRKKPLKVNYRNLAGGILLGVPNYFSIFFLLRALQNDLFASASIFTINNVAIVMFSTFLGILLFKERMSIKNWSGILLAVVSIVLVALF
ncbi:DMT family transporter [Flagellimonas allohymeniacidonis]|uniref:DMT family transporter n=1 Tax=Flagellimonas allohymeniacidonis TaxID=2517819 RepID=A0A4Q8QF03_9FLAO|nr:DMT family transporter [Allomuricauda hymeniacidonis]TAI49082.1 DMT family transporter [Allomuricauda hymeniacidonis]